ncbi:hypothetical protein [Clostridium niameyense]|uniref:hypothetical protein n=1 Tax=Clostridium niameyense TaxID=1622073 RepID=UPI00067F6229|nr:hypothetical protein [Clostridium niameyense]
MKSTVKKGYSLMIVLVSISILIILGVSLLSLTVSSYNKRFSESLEKRNQYFSEAGLDIAYGIIGKTIENAIEHGNKSALSYMEKLDDEKYPKKEDGTVDEVKLKSMQNNIFKREYKGYIKNNIKDNIELGIKIDGIRKNPYIKNKHGNTPKVKLENEKQCKHEGFQKIKVKNKEREALSLNLKSTYKDKSEKILKVTYNVLVPNYGEIYSVESKKVEVPIKPVWTKAICADGNLKAKGKLNIDGDIYIKGRDKDGGINIEGANCNFKGDIVTPGVFKFKSPNNIVNVNEDKNNGGNIYAANVLLDKEASNSKLQVKKAVYTNNDLVFNALKSHVNIENGFYGLNDINKSSDIKEEEKSKVSSSILVNTEDLGEKNGSEINIGNELLLMGTAYIKTKPAYQTGESVAVKGNYKVYCYPVQQGKYELDEEGNIRRDNNGEPILRKRPLNEDNVIFEYRDPLILVTKFKNGEELTWQDKSDYFALSATKSSEKLKKNGISLPKNKTTIGSGVSDGKFYTGNYSVDLEEDIRKRAGNYAIMAYAMGDATGLSIRSSTIDKENFQNSSWHIYENGKLLRTVSTEVDFSKIKYKNVNKNSVIYLNGDESKQLTLIGEGGDRQGNSDFIDVSNKENKGIIVTKGNVYLSGKINFRGTVISLGDIIILDDGEKNIIYDKDYIKKIVAKNYDCFKNVFIGPQTNKENVLTYVKASPENDLGTDDIRQKLITVEKWKILK